MVHDLIVGLSGQAMTIFLNSHNLDEVSRVCSKVAILHHGTIRAYDSIERLRAGPSGTGLEITLSDPAQGDRAVAMINTAAWRDLTSQERGHILGHTFRTRRVSGDRSACQGRLRGGGGSAAKTDP